MSNDAKETSPVEEILQSWLDDPDLTLFCGHWGHGGVMELLPRGGARLSGPRYGPPFDGLRELRLDNGAHHVHLDLGRLTRAWYVMAPSVCYGFRPSFELRLTGANADPREGFGLGLALGHPYAGRGLRAEPVRRYFRRAAEHMASFPGTVSFLCDRSRTPHDTEADWDFIESLLEVDEADSPSSMEALRAALRRREANAAALA